MPSNVVKSFAKKSGKSVSEIEAMWDQHTAELEKKGFKGNSLYAQVTAILKKRLHIKESSESRLVGKYLMQEEKDNIDKCAHCHKNVPAKGKTICGKCATELKSFRNKTNKDKDDGNEG